MLRASPARLSAGAVIVGLRSVIAGVIRPEDADLDACFSIAQVFLEALSAVGYLEMVVRRILFIFASTNQVPGTNLQIGIRRSYLL